MSSGDISIDGPHARYELRMPIYEMAHVTDNSHDGNPLRIVRHAPHHDPFSEGILVRPEFLCERLINNNDQRRIRVVHVGKKPASN